MKTQLCQYRFMMVFNIPKNNHMFRPLLAETCSYFFAIKHHHKSILPQLCCMTDITSTLVKTNEQFHCTTQTNKQTYSQLTNSSHFLQVNSIASLFRLYRRIRFGMPSSVILIILLYFIYFILYRLYTKFILIRLLLLSQKPKHVQVCVCVCVCR